MLNRYAEQGWVKIAYDYIIKITHSYALRPILQTKGEMPDYLMFDFSECSAIMIDLPWGYKEIVRSLNKCDKYITGIDSCIVVCLSGKSYGFVRHNNEWIRSHYINCIKS